MKIRKIALLILLVVLTFAATAFAEDSASKYTEAQDLMGRGKFTEAATIFDSISTYEDASKLALYCKACAMCDSGYYDIGISTLESLGDFKDCKLRVNYYSARLLDESTVGSTDLEAMEAAKFYYNQNPLFLDSFSRIVALDERIEGAKSTIYNDAIKAGDNGQYDKAISAFEQITGYEDSKQRATYYAIRKAEDELVDSTDLNAVQAVAARYVEIGAYLDCVDRAAALIDKENAILANYYAIGEQYLTQNQWDEALAAFEMAGDYSDAKDRITYCNIRKTEETLSESDDTAAITEVVTRYQSMGAYLDCAERAKNLSNCINTILDEKYDAAVALMDGGKYQEASTAFATLNGYKDSNEKVFEAIKHILKNSSVGSYVILGSYEQDNDSSNGKEDIEWLVLEKENNRVLVISRYALDCQPYNKEPTAVTWEDCSLRKWLNDDFVNTAFNNMEQGMMLTATVSADKNPDCSTYPGKATQDKVFLLSILEVNKYFASDAAEKCKNTAYVEKQGAQTLENGGFGFWWLRSPGDGQEFAAFVSNNGGVATYGFRVSADFVAVRPALWIDLEP